MDAVELLNIINSGETSKVQFKRELKKKRAGKLIAEMVAMSNYEGGYIIVGVEDKTGDIAGVTFSEIESANNLFFDWASNNVKPPIVIYTETIDVEDKKTIVVTIPKGIDKPYCDNNMVYWIKSAANTRRVTPSELQRLFQGAGKYYAEREPIINSGIQDINKDLFRQFYKKRFDENIADENLQREMQNLRLLDNGMLTLAGALLFGDDMNILAPEFHISAIHFLGNKIEGDEYRNNRIIRGNLKNQFYDAMQFAIGTILRVQGNDSFNSSGTLEIPKVVFEELIVNAIVHRDYFINDSIKLFIFDNRIEIKSPGKLPNTLTVNDIKKGLPRRSRNVVLTSFINDLLPYKGVGSGILRALKAYPDIGFENNMNAEYFKATIYRDQELP